MTVLNASIIDITASAIILKGTIIEWSGITVEFLKSELIALAKEVRSNGGALKGNIKVDNVTYVGTHDGYIVEV